MDQSDCIYLSRITAPMPCSNNPGSLSSHRRCRSRDRSPRLPRGFTLIELLVVMSVLAVLAALAAPSFLTQIANQRVSSAAQELQTLLQFARAQSVYNRSAISVTSSGQDWSARAGSALLRQTPLPAAVIVTPGADSADGVQFDATGAARPTSGNAAQYTLALSAPQATRMHCISVTRAGLVRQQRQAANSSC